MIKETLSYRITYAFRMCARSCYIDGLNWIVKLIEKQRENFIGKVKMFWLENLWNFKH